MGLSQGQGTDAHDKLLPVPITIQSRRRRGRTRHVYRTGPHSWPNPPEAPEVGLVHNGGLGSELGIIIGLVAGNNTPLLFSQLHTQMLKLTPFLTHLTGLSNAFVFDFWFCPGTDSQGLSAQTNSWVTQGRGGGGVLKGGGDDFTEQERG